MVVLDRFDSLFELIGTLSSEEQCIEYLEKIRWRGRVVSPFDVTSKVYKCSAGYWCKNSNRLFNVKTGTIFENTKIPMRKWFMAIWILSSHKKGISSVQLSKDINVTQKTGWFMLQRIRRCFECDYQHQLNNEVEVDETYLGGNLSVKRKRRGGAVSNSLSDKPQIPIIGMVERRGRLISHIITDAHSSTLTSEILKMVDRGATLYTDEWGGYDAVGDLYRHYVIRHKVREYVNGHISTNTIECFWGVLKRGLSGIYQNPSKKHLQMYINEFVFRYNTRDMNDYDRFNILLSRVAKRLRYRDLIDVKYCRADVISV